MTIYKMSPHDLDCYAFREQPQLTSNQRLYQSILPDMSGAVRPGHKRCPACGELLDKWNEPLNGFTIRKRTWDCGATYDGVVVVSQRFKDLYEANRFRGLTFKALPDDPVYFSIMPNRIVQCDTVRRKIRLEGLCEVCHRYESVNGGVPPILKDNPSIHTSEFVRSDIELGGRDEKHPLILCGENAARLIIAAKFKNVIFRKCEV